MDKLFYTIGEVAKMLDENTSTIRFWTNSFPKDLNPKRNAKGNRLYSPENIDTLKQIKFLLKDCGLTLDGAAKRLGAEKNSLKKRVEALEGLKKIRKDLEAVRKSL